ncbi:hypothetical protein [Rhodohalobacter mucosus]|uniref:Membrane protein (TIGR04086 family) n=1 Tax=Rhodohalobacter mucosus TaxID=2079485 RepID=A0A316TV54_9BACT|nr:hypothetical protein [Rhodohalobacter mucosus]PWN07778.1 hypothetical protein DDZ15_01830 [Rhodohalobacter mucosus]
MLETTRQNYKYIGLAIATIAAGIPLWTYSGSAIDFTSYSFLAIWAAIGIAASFFSLFVINLNMRDMASSFVSGYVIAVILYFVSRILVSSMVHTQFILSLLMAIGVGLISGFSGSLIWRFIKKK